MSAQSNQNTYFLKKMDWKTLSTILLSNVQGVFSLSDQLVQWVALTSYSVGYLLNFKVVLRLRNLGLFQVLVLSVLHFVRTCLFVFVSFGVLQGATNTRKISYSLLVLGKISQSKRQFLKTKFPIEGRCFEAFKQGYSFLWLAIWLKGVDFHGSIKNCPSPCFLASATLFKNLEL